MVSDLHKKIIDNMDSEINQIEKDLDSHEKKVQEIKAKQGFFAKIKKMIFGN